MIQFVRNNLMKRCGVSVISLAAIAGVLLSSCTYFQERTERQFSGVILDARDGRPVAGATVILAETRHPFIFFPFATDFWRSIAHAATDSDGHFSFRVCMTDGPYLLHWDGGGNISGQEGSGTDLWFEDDPRNVRVRLYTKPVKRAFDYSFFDYWIESEDSSLTRTCAH